MVKDWLLNFTMFASNVRLIPTIKGMPERRGFFNDCTISKYIFIIIPWRY